MGDDTGYDHGAVGFMGAQSFGGDHPKSLEFRSHEHRRMTIR